MSKKFLLIIFVVAVIFSIRVFISCELKRVKALAVIGCSFYFYYQYNVGKCRLILAITLLLHSEINC